MAVPPLCPILTICDFGAKSRPLQGQAFFAAEADARWQKTQLAMFWRTVRFPHRWGKALSGKADDNQTKCLRPRRRIHAAKVGSGAGCRTTTRPATLCASDSHFARRMIPTKISTSVATLGQPTGQSDRQPNVQIAGRLQNRTTYQSGANGTNSYPAIPATGTSAISRPGNHTDVQRAIRTMRCKTNQPATPRQSRVQLAPRSVKSLSTVPVSPFLCHII